MADRMRVTSLIGGTERNKSLRKVFNTILTEMGEPCAGSSRPSLQWNGSRRRLDCLVDGLAATEAQAVIQAHGSFVLGGHFEKGPAQARAAETVQRLQQERLTQA